MAQQDINKDALEIGSILDGEHYQYKIESILGQGSFGITYKASLILKGGLGNLRTAAAKVAIKEFFMTGVNGRDSSVSSAISIGNQEGMFGDYMRKFRREAKNLASLNHRNIIEVLEAFEANNTSYYVMEYIDGGSLDDLIKKKGKLSEEESITLLNQMGEALTVMHSQGMLHLDLKPSNVMLRNEDSPVLIDFGLSKHFDENGMAEASTKIGGGTPGYAPLEQSTYKNTDGIPVTMDVYALAATMFKMLTGMRPPEASDILNEGFPFKELSEKGVSNHVMRVLSIAMASRKGDRYQSVANFINALNAEPEPEIIEPEEPVIEESVPPVQPPVQSYEQQAGINLDEEKTEIFTGNSHSDDSEKTQIAMNNNVMSRDNEMTEVSSGNSNIEYPTPEIPEESKSNTLKYILIFAVCAVVTGIIIFFAMNRNSGSSVTAADSDSVAIEDITVATVSDMALSNAIGNFKYTGEVNEASQPNGQGKAVFSNGNTYDGEWVNGKMTGECVYTLSNGDTFKGTFKDDYYNKGRYTIKSSGEYFEGSYLNGSPSVGKWMKKNGSLIETIGK